MKLTTKKKMYFLVRIDILSRRTLVNNKKIKAKCIKDVLKEVIRITENKRFYVAQSLNRFKAVYKKSVSLLLLTHAATSTD